ncbi:MAG TPA: YciI family protein [Fimbriimonadaceae bacterium]|nr:YciI family protein [Fimbriimonadaceae bacterium]
MLALLGALVFASVPQEAAKPAEGMRVVQLAILVDGKVKPSAAESAKLQMGHLQFLQGLWEKRAALVVGPLEEGGELHGIVVLDLKSADEAKKLLAKDPFVKAGYLDTKVVSWYCLASVMQKAPKFLDVAPHWFCILERPSDAPNVTPEESSKIQAGHMENIQAMAKEGILLLAGPLVEAGAWRGIFIFKDEPKEKVLDRIGKDPAVKARRLEPKLVRWYTAKGSFAPLK